MQYRFVNIRALSLQSRSAAFISVFASLFLPFCALHAGGLPAGNTSTPPAASSGTEAAEQAKPALDPNRPDLGYSGISIVRGDGTKPDRVIFRKAPADAIDLVIPDGVTEISGDAFLSCRRLESVSFPNSVNYIPSNAFPDSIFSGTLKRVTIPANASIGNGAFKLCRSLESVTLTKGGETIAPPREDAFIGSDAFNWCAALKHFEFPSGIRTIGNRAFNVCSEMELTAIPDSVTVIGNDAFGGCCGIKKLKMPNGIKAIGKRAFGSCRNLEEFELPTGRIEIGKGAFQSCLSLKRFRIPVIPSGKIPDDMFNDCRNLETVELADGIDSIGERAFESCAELKEIVIPEGVRTIGFRAFAACGNLKSVSLPASMESIGQAAFLGCRNLKTVTLPDRITQFANAFNLSDTRLVLPQENTRYAFTPEGALIDNETHALLSFPCARGGDYTIPDGILEIAPGAFRSCSLRSLTIPDGVKILGAGAFAYSALEEIAIPESVMEFQAGESVPGMTQSAVDFSVTDPPHYENYARSLFKGCRRLKRVTLPANMKEIPFAMFDQCTSMEEIAIPDGVTSFGESAFRSCESLKRIAVPSGVRMLPPRAFLGCRSLEEVGLPDGLESLDNFVFSGCMALMELEIPESVKYIDSYAFSNSPCEKYLQDRIEFSREREDAEAGDIEAMFNLGSRYEYGVSVRVDLTEAVKWYAKAAEQDHAEAKKALEYLAETDAGAQFALGGVCEEKKDLTEAVKWYAKGAEQGHAEATTALERLAETNAEARLALEHLVGSETGTEAETPPGPLP